MSNTICGCNFCRLIPARGIHKQKDCVNPNAEFSFWRPNKLGLRIISRTDDCPPWKTNYAEMTVFCQLRSSKVRVFMPTSGPAWSVDRRGRCSQRVLVWASSNPKGSQVCLQATGIFEPFAPHLASSYPCGVSQQGHLY